MKPKWMEKDEAESGYGATASTLLKNLLMGVGIGGALEYLLRRKKNKESFTVQDERNLKELLKQQKAAKKGKKSTKGMNLKDAIKAAEKKKK